MSTMLLLAHVDATGPAGGAGAQPHRERHLGAQGILKCGLKGNKERSASNSTYYFVYSNWR